MAEPIDLSAVQQATAQLSAALGRVTGQATAAGGAMSSAGSQFSGSLKNVGRGMAQLRSEMDKGRVGYGQAGQALRGLQSSFDGLTAEAQKSAAGQRIAAEQTRMSGELLRRGVGEIAADLAKAGIGAALEYFKNQFFTAAKGIQDNVGGMQFAFNLQNRAIEDQVTMLDQLSKGAGAAAAALALIPGPWAKAGAIMAGTTSVIAGMSAATQKLVGGGVQLLQTEMIKTQSAFRAITASGALLSGGMEEVRKYSAVAGMDVKEFGSMVSQNSKSMVQFGGSVGDGMKKFSIVSGEMGKYRAGLLNLGISTQEQSQATIDYMALQQQSGKLQNMSAAEVAKGTAQYLGNMKAMSALTGEDVKSQQARVKAAAEEAGVQAALAEGGAEMDQKFRDLVARFPGYEKEIGQLMTVGEITDPVRATMLASNAELDAVLRKGVENIKDNNINAKAAAEERDATMKRDGAAIAANAREQQKTFGLISSATGQMGEQAALANRNFALGQQGAEQQAKGTKSGLQQVADLVTTTDALTNASSESAKAFADASKTIYTTVKPYLEKFVKEGPPGGKGLVRTTQEGISAAVTGVKVAGNIGDKADVKGNLDRLPSVLDSLTAAITSLVGVLPRKPGSAEGGIVEGSKEGFFSLTHGREAIIPLPSGESIPVNLQGAEKMFAGEMAAQREKQAAVAAPAAASTPDIAASVAAAIESAMSGPNGFGKAIGELKTQVADSGQQQTGVLQQQIEKLDALVTAMQDSADSNRRIANEMA